MATVSIITPSLNQGCFLERTIRSVLDQNISGLEYVVVDGGSSDESISILRRHEDRLRWLSEKDRGQAHAVNKGLRRTTGEVIGWLNSDDVYYPGAVGKVLQFLLEHPKIDVVYGDAEFVDVEDHVIGRYPIEAWDSDRLKNECYLCQPAVFWRRRVLEQCGLLDESLYYCMDYEYWLRLSQHEVRFAYLPSTLAASRLYPANKTLRNQRQVREEINDMLRQRLGEVPDAWILKYARIRLCPNQHPMLKYPVSVLGMLPVTLAASWRWNRTISLGPVRQWVAQASSL